jgi:hypothetical protein
MSVLRVLAILVAILALLFGLSRASESSRTSEAIVTPCSIQSISLSFQQLDVLNNFGCDNGWAWAFATVGPTAHEVSVTEILHWSAPLGRWLFAKRDVVCRSAMLLPRDVYLRGCFSN